MSVAVDATPRYYARAIGAQYVERERERERERESDVRSLADDENIIIC